jgi:N-acetylglucosaminyldiphosphoundecaprenol N-acetyl-beta-D-mannosaminyltransferase
MHELNYPESISKVDVLGCRVNNITLEGAVDLIEKWIREFNNIPRRVVATGFHGIWEAYKNPALRQVLNSADLFCPDGIAPVWLSRVYGEPIVSRVPGPDLMAAFLARADERAYSSFFLGDTTETLTALRDKIQGQYPGHRVAGVLSPPFRAVSVEEDCLLVDEINRAEPDVLWVGLGMPKQEWWIEQHVPRLHVPVVAGVGAAFRFLSGRVKRAPRWVGECGFEWLWRLAVEPSKVWRRDLIDGPRFLASALVECVRKNSRAPIETGAAVSSNKHSQRPFGNR